MGFASVLSMATDVFRFLGPWLPLRPLPLGVVACAYFIKLGALLIFLNQVTNSDSFPHKLATATECAQMLKAFQLGHSSSQAKAPPFFGYNQMRFAPTVAQNEFGTTRS